MTRKHLVQFRRMCPEVAVRMSRSVKKVAVGVAIGVFCASLGGCISDTGTSLANTSQSAGGNAPLRYYGGPKSPMWPDTDKRQ